jgi:transcriptional regulator with XRE-family HTH domain
MKLEDLGALIKAERKKAGLTQAQLAERLGIKHSSIPPIESGKNLEFTTIQRIAEALEFDLIIEFLPRSKR